MKANKYEDAIKAIENNYPPSNYTILREALDLAIEELKTQIPVMPIKSFYNEGDYTWECPICENTVAEGQFYCQYCRQRFQAH